MNESRVEWREWGPEPFALAERTGRPVLLWLTTTWCAECRQMATETFGDPRIAANVNEGFVPIHADGDRQPRVRERYAMGGFPSTVFLTPDGGVLTGAAYLGPEGFRDVLDSVRETYDARGDAAGTVPRALRTDPPGGELSPGIVRHFAGQLEAQWDRANDGWGDEAKFPLPETIRFALRHDRSRAERALDAVDRGLRAPDGGFYRYARTPDWSDPARERTLAANAGLLRAFADAYLTTGEDRYRTTAAATARFLRRDLGLDRGFAGSLGPDDRRDDTRYAGSNAAAADALLAYSAYTDDRAARDAASDTLAFLREELIADGRVVHFRTDDERTVTDDEPRSDERPATDGTTAAGTGNASESATGEADLLASAAWTVRAFTTAEQVVGEGLPTARAVADRAIAVLGDGDRSDEKNDPETTDTPTAPTRAPTGTNETTARGAFRDGPASGPGLLDHPLYPLDGTARLADALVDLALLTGEDRYRERARRALAAFADATDRMGVQVAGYGRAVERTLRDPLVVSVGTPPGSDLHRAALRLADHGKCVIPDTTTTPDGTATLRGTDDTATDPAELERLVTRHASDSDA